MAVEERPIKQLWFHPIRAPEMQSGINSALHLNAQVKEPPFNGSYFLI
jgi:hypothetical protein